MSTIPISFKSYPRTLAIVFLVLAIAAVTLLQARLIQKETIVVNVNGMVGTISIVAIAAGHGVHCFFNTGGALKAYDQALFLENKQGAKGYHYVHRHKNDPLINPCIDLLRDILARSLKSKLSEFLKEFIYKMLENIKNR